MSSRPDAGRSVAILLAGGAGTRLQPSENKVYLPVAGRPLLEWSLTTLEASPLIDDIVLVVRAIDATSAEAVLHRAPTRKLRCVVEGGTTRHASEHAGLMALARDIEAGTIGLVLIHDAARPFLSHHLLRLTVRRARAVGGALPALPLEEPVVRGQDGQTVESMPAEQLRRVQTPQAFRARELLTAYRTAATVGFVGVDTAQSVERFSDLPVEMVPGDPENIKVTFVEDLFVAESLALHWSPGDPV